MILVGVFQRGWINTSNKGHALVWLKRAFESLGADGGWAIVMRVVVVVLLVVGLGGIVSMFFGHGIPIDVSSTQGLIAGVLLITIVVLVMIMVLTALYGGMETDMEKRIRTARDTLSPLLAIFGTVIGFYFGSQIGDKAAKPTESAATVKPAADKPATVKPAADKPAAAG